MVPQGDIVEACGELIVERCRDGGESLHDHILAAARRVPGVDRA
jgi:hypothetical protein